MWLIKIKQNSEKFKNNYKLYLMEALGLAAFMISACFFSALLWHPGAFLNIQITSNFGRNLTMGIAMGLTALGIFYSPFTAPSGAHINPAVTIVQLYLGNIGKLNSAFYIFFQFLGGTLAVYLMSFLMKEMLTQPPVNCAVTVPGLGVSESKAAIFEICISFVMITMVLNVSNHQKLKKYTRLFASCLVCTFVIVAGPVSGFGMNPARTFASALPAHTFTSFWIYMLCPILGMLSAAIIYKIKLKKWI